MNCFIQIFVLIVAVEWCGEVKCKPHLKKKHIFKTFQLGLVALPPKHVAFDYEKITPFGTYTFKHFIKKRDIAATEIPSPLANEVHAVDTVGEPLKVPITYSLEKTEEAIDEQKLPAEVIISSIVEPLEPGKQISFLLPVDSEVVITPAVKEVEGTVPINANLEPEPKPEEISTSSVTVDIAPKPIDIPPPPEVQLVEPNVVVINTPIESTVPPIIPVSASQNTNTPVISPVVNNLPVTPFLYTNIRGIPFYTPANVVPFITPAAVPIPEVLPQSPPPVKETPPVVKEEPPNFFVKSSRFVLYFGSMMLQMLSQFVNGRANLNQIPLPPPFPGGQ